MPGTHTTLGISEKCRTVLPGNNLHYISECVAEYTEALIDFHHTVAFINMYMYNMIQL